MSDTRFTVLLVSACALFLLAFAAAVPFLPPLFTVQPVVTTDSSAKIGMNPYTGGLSVFGIDITTGHLATQPRP